MTQQVATILPHRRGDSQARITQCYLPPGRADISAFTPAKLVLDSSTPEGCKAELRNSCRAVSRIRFVFNTHLQTKTIQINLINQTSWKIYVVVLRLTSG